MIGKNGKDNDFIVTIAPEDRIKIAKDVLKEMKSVWVNEKESIVTDAELMDLETDIDIVDSAIILLKYYTVNSKEYYLKY